MRCILRSYKLLVPFNDNIILLIQQNKNYIFYTCISVSYFCVQKFRHCLKKLAIVDITLEKLGTIINYHQLYAKTVRLVVGWFVTAILINCVHVLYAQYQYNYGIPRIICISMIMNYCSHINLIDDLTITSILKLVSKHYYNTIICVQYIT